MSSIEEELDIDIKRFFEQIENQSPNDKIKTLKNLFGKYLHLNTCEYKMDHYDLNSIISQAKTLFSNESFPVYLGEDGKKVSESYQNGLCIVESTISHLNGKNCLKKLPKFNKRKF